MKARLEGLGAVLPGLRGPTSCPAPAIGIQREHAGEVNALLLDFLLGL